MRTHIFLAILFIISIFPSQPAHAHSLYCPQWEKKIVEAGLPLVEFDKIAHRESRCRIKAINIIWDKQGNIIWALNKNRSYDSGLFQINSIHHQLVKKVCKGDLSQLLILDCNLSVAKSLYDDYGLKPWRLLSPPSLPSSSFSK